MRKILFVTGSRADWGMIENIEKACKIYFSTKIEKFDLKTYDGRPFDIISNMKGVFSLVSEHFLNNKPDLLLLVGDRYEIFCAAAAATIFNVPIAHVHGGEITEGSNDNQFRHAITKMSHLHFTANEIYRQRIIQMGEQPDTVFAVGAPGLDGIVDIPISSKVCDLLITYHPATLELESVGQFRELLAALPKEKEILFTGSNADVGGRQIDGMIDDYCLINTKSQIRRDMTREQYLVALHGADAIIGNSSSGIIEAPVLCTPTIDIGNRQKGRMAGDSVIHCAPTREAIKDAFGYLYSDKFKPKFTNLYGDGHASERIAKILSERDFTTKKTFYEVKA